MGRIAYVSDKDEICTIDHDGGNKQLVTEQGRAYTWPTWSPDGRGIAYSAYSSGNNGHGRLGLYLKPVDGGRPRLLYSNEPGTDAIAHRTPHYVVWSPDGRKIAFIAQTHTGGLTLFVCFEPWSDEASYVMEGAPLYASWSPDSRTLLVHCRQDYYLVSVEGDIEVIPIAGRSAMSMTPSWSPDGKRIGLLQYMEGERQELVEVGPDGDLRTLTELEGPGAFAWRPDSSSIALVRDPLGRSGFYRGIWLLEPEGQGPVPLTDDPVLSFFWSPDGGKIAYVTPLEGSEGGLRWALLDTEGGETTFLANFQPSREQLTAFMFFDQYTQSHRFWSPDGLHLVTAGFVRDQLETAEELTGGESGVYVVDVTGQAKPRVLAHGCLGVWSPV